LEQLPTGLQQASTAHFHLPTTQAIGIGQPILCSISATQLPPTLPNDVDHNDENDENFLYSFKVMAYFKQYKTQQ
jgi:hypothetical protein